MKFVFPRDFERKKYSKRVATGRNPSLTLKKTGRDRWQTVADPFFFSKKTVLGPFGSGRDPFFFNVNDGSRPVATRFEYFSVQNHEEI